MIDGKLAFVIDALHFGGSTMGSSGASSEDGGLRKIKGSLGGVIEFRGVIQIISAEANNLAGRDGRQELHIRERPGPAGDRPISRNVSGTLANRLAGNDSLQNFRLRGGANLFRRNLAAENGRASSGPFSFCGIGEINACGPARGAAACPGLNDVLVATPRAHQKNPIEHGNEAVGNRAKHENVEGSHAAFEQRNAFPPRYRSSVRSVHAVRPANEQFPGLIAAEAQVRESPSAG
jgi:hypothetical protein